MLRRGQRDSNDRPDAGAILQAHPLRRGHGALEAATPFPIHRQGKGALLPAESLGRGLRGGPIQRHTVWLRCKLAPPRLRCLNAAVGERAAPGPNSDAPPTKR